jgi:hypothetical protein
MPDDDWIGLLFWSRIVSKQARVESKMLTLKSQIEIQATLLANTDRKHIKEIADKINNLTEDLQRCYNFE